MDSEGGHPSIHPAHPSLRKMRIPSSILRWPLWHPRCILAPQIAMSRRPPPYRSSALARSTQLAAVESTHDDDKTRTRAPSRVSVRRVAHAYPRSHDATTRLVHNAADFDAPLEDCDDELKTNLLAPSTPETSFPASSRELETRLERPTQSESISHARPLRSGERRIAQTSSIPRHAESARPQATARFVEEARHAEQPRHAQQARTGEQPNYLGRPRSGEQPHAEQPRFLEQPRYVVESARSISRSEDVQAQRIAATGRGRTAPLPASAVVTSRSHVGPSPSGAVRQPEQAEPQPTHDLSVNSPWTFPTGSTSRTAPAKAAPFGSRLHVIGASVVLLVSVVVLIASAISFHSSTQQGSSEQAAAPMQAQTALAAPQGYASATRTMTAPVQTFAAPVQPIAMAQPQTVPMQAQAQAIVPQTVAMPAAQGAQYTQVASVPQTVQYVAAPAPTVMGAATPPTGASVNVVPQTPAPVAAAPTVRWTPKAAPAPARPAPAKKADGPKPTSLEAMMSDDMLR